MLGKPTRLSKRGFDDTPMPTFDSNKPTTKEREPSYDLGHRVRVGGGGGTVGRSRVSADGQHGRAGADQ